MIRGAYQRAAGGGGGVTTTANGCSVMCIWGGAGGCASWTTVRLLGAGDAAVPIAMKTQTHTCHPEAAALIGEMSNSDEGLEDMSESVDELRAKLANMKRLMEERRGMTLGEISSRKRRLRDADIIDGNFLSWIFGTALAVILTVSFYAFYNLYNAVLKKFPSKHTEL